MSRFNYPAQTGLYKVMVKNGTGWQNFDACRLQVSVGQSKHEGEKFKAVLSWAKARFKKVIICVNDTLQRYNYIHDLGMSEHEASDFSYSQGNAWINRNLNGVSNVTVERWGRWIQKEDFKSLYEFYLRLYTENEIFRNSIDDEISSFAKRRSEPVKESFFSLCKHFLIEETAVFTIMINEVEAADIYPGSTLLPIRLMQEGRIEEQRIGKVHFTRIDFSKNRSFSM